MFFYQILYFDLYFFCLREKLCQVYIVPGAAADPQLYHIKATVSSQIPFASFFLQMHRKDIWDASLITLYIFDFTSVKQMPISVLNYQCRATTSVTLNHMKKLISDPGRLQAHAYLCYGRKRAIANTRLETPTQNLQAATFNPTPTALARYRWHSWAPVTRSVMQLELATSQNNHIMWQLNFFTIHIAILSLSRY